MVWLKRLKVRCVAFRCADSSLELPNDGLRGLLHRFVLQPGTASNPGRVWPLCDQAAVFDPRQTGSRLVLDGGLSQKIATLAGPAFQSTRSGVFTGNWRRARWFGCCPLTWLMTNPHCG